MCDSKTKAYVGDFIPALLHFGLLQEKWVGVHWVQKTKVDPAGSFFPKQAHDDPLVWSRSPHTHTRTHTQSTGSLRLILEKRWPGFPAEPSPLTDGGRGLRALQGLWRSLESIKPALAKKTLGEFENVKEYYDKYVAHQGGAQVVIVDYTTTTTCCCSLRNGGEAHTVADHGELDEVDLRTLANIFWDK